METKFTKGNWLREKTTVYSLHQVGWRNGKPIMSNKFYFQSYPDFKMENAELEAEKVAKRMAANDDLLEALDELLKVTATTPIDIEKLFEAKEKARLAIQKATE